MLIGHFSSIKTTSIMEVTMTKVSTLKMNPCYMLCYLVCAQPILKGLITTSVKWKRHFSVGIFSFPCLSLIDIGHQLFSIFFVDNFFSSFN